MRKLVKPTAVLCSVALLLNGCAWMKEHKKIVTGAGIGAVAGGVIGGLAKGKKGAVYGALAGALAGGLIGAYLEHKDRDAKATNQAYKYDPHQGIRLELANVAADPATVRAGDKTYLQATYALMAPDPNQQLAVTETRIVTLGGQKVAELSSNVTRVPGTYTSQVPITLKPDAPRGRYELQVIVAAGGTSAKRTSHFIVN